MYIVRVNKYKTPIYVFLQKLCQHSTPTKAMQTLHTDRSPKEAYVVNSFSAQLPPLRACQGSRSLHPGLQAFDAARFKRALEIARR